MTQTQLPVVKTEDKPLFVFAPTKKQVITVVATTLALAGVTAAAVYVKKNPEVLEHVDESVTVES